MYKIGGYRWFVLDTVEFIKELILIPSFRINVKFVKHIPGDASSPKGYTTAIHEVDSAYMEANIEVSKMLEKKFQERNYRYIQEDLAHEFAHLLTNPFYDFAEEGRGRRLSERERERLRKLNEHQTQKIGAIIAKLIPPPKVDKNGKLIVKRKSS